MWRVDASKVRILVGRHQVIGYAAGRQQPQLCVQEPVTEASGDPLGGLALAVERCGNALATAMDSQSFKAVVVLESTWLPVLGIHLGPARFKAGLAERFAKHRLQELFDIDAALEADLTLWDHRWGEPFGLVAGLSEATKEAILVPLRQTGAEVSTVQPALNHALSACRSRTSKTKRSGLVLVEQDRALVGLLQGRRLIELDVGADKPSNIQEARAALAAACFRAGIEVEGMPLTLAGWGEELSSVMDTAGCEPFIRVDCTQVP